MGILTLGLLGVAALFPVGGYYMQKAEISDRGSAIAQSAMSDLEARGFLNPRAWLAVEYGAIPAGATWRPQEFGKPVASEFQTRVAKQLTTSNFEPILVGQTDVLPLKAPGQMTISQEFGSVFVLDPLGASSAVGVKHGWGRFPYIDIPPSGAAAYYNYPPAWNHWKPNIAPASKLGWPIMRVTLPAPDPTGVQPIGPLVRRTAEQLFTSQDDLAADLPDNPDRPSQQLWAVDESSGTSVPLAREWQGDYSWLATIAPPTAQARNALLRPDGNSYEYDVSVVVFYKRPVDALIDPMSFQTFDDVSSSEIQVTAAVKSKGLNGGELLLSADQNATQPFSELKVGQWLSLCGPHPRSTVERPSFFFAWYQVMAIDEEIAQADRYNATGTVQQRYVSLRGPEFPWEPQTQLLSKAHLSNSLWAVICPGAVAVHTKTLRLEGQSPWSF